MCAVSWIGVRVGESGQSLPRPHWVRWIAQDSSGAWWGYSEEPLRNDTGWYENEVGRCVRIGHGPAQQWELSLQAVDAQ